MKKLTILLFSILISFNSYGKWTDTFGYTFKYDESSLLPIKNPYNLYHDLDSYKKRGNFAYWWELIDYVNPVEGYSSVASYKQGDCGVSRIKTLSSVAYKGNMAWGEKLKLKTEDEWSYHLPYSVPDIVLFLVCEAPYD